MTRTISTAGAQVLLAAKERAERELADCMQWVREATEDLAKAQTARVEAETQLRVITADIASLITTSGVGS